MSRFNTGNPIGSGDVKDLSDNAKNLDVAENSVTELTWRDRFGRNRKTMHGIEVDSANAISEFQQDGAQVIQEAKDQADRVIANLGFFSPVDYTTGLNVDSRNFTVTYNGIVYAAQPSAVPFTTGVWDAAQWYPIQNVLNQKNLLVFDTYAEASAAAATLPDGQIVYVTENLIEYKVSGGDLVFSQSLGDTRSFMTFAEASAAKVPASVSAISVSCYAHIFDAGGGTYARVTIEPIHKGKLQTADGSWFELMYDGTLSASCFGGYLGVSQDNSETLQAALDFVKSKAINSPVIDLCGFEWGIASGLKASASRTLVKNGRFNALGTSENWGVTAMFAPNGGAFRVMLERVEFNGNLIANLIDESDGISFRIDYVSGYRFKDFGITYTGGGCYYTNFIFQKFTGSEPQRSRVSARMQGYGLDIRGVDGRIGMGVVHGRIRTTETSWTMLVSQVHGYNSSEARTTFTSATGVATFSPTWEVDDVSHIRVEKNGSLINAGTGYTATLSSDGRPEVTVSGLVPSDKVEIKALTPNVTAWEIRGSNSDFANCYFDNGYVDIYDMDNRFSGVGLYLSDRIRLDSHVRIFTSTPNQTIGNLVWNVRRANSSLRVFGFHTTGSGSWNANTAYIETLTNVRFSQNAEANVRGATTTSIVDIKVSGNARAFTQYQGIGTTTTVAAGANGDDYEIMTDGSTRFRVTRQGSFFSGTTQITNPEGLLKLKPLTKATLPAPSGATSQCMAYISDGDLNKKLVVCDGSVWRYADGSLV